MTNVSQNTVFIIHLEKLNFINFMPKYNAHKRMAKLVYGRADKAGCIAYTLAIINKAIKISIQKGDHKPHRIHHADKKGDL